MNVSGPGNSIPAAYRLPPVERPRAVPPAVEVKQKTPASAAPIRDESVPAGSDPALWSILTSEERAFFARQAALGPIHYGPGQRGTAPVSDGPLGGRIDVRA
jgi:hypothetical protein